MPDKLIRTDIGIGTFISTTNPDLKIYEGKKGTLSKVYSPERERYILTFDMLRYWIKTSFITRISFKGSTINRSTLIAFTESGSTYAFDMEFNKKSLSPFELINMIAIVHTGQNKP